MRIVGLGSSKINSENAIDGIRRSNNVDKTPFMATPVKNEEVEKKKGLSVKKLTNILGTVAGIGIIGASAIYMAKRPKWMKINSKEMGVLETKIKSKQEQMEVALRTAKGEEKNGGFLYSFGSKVQGAVERIGSELSNNLLYGIGTCCIMPLVLLYSPFGKKDSSKEDKIFAVIRQPISFATMFSIQLTNDKVFSRWSKAIVDQNLMELPEILENGVIKKGENGYTEEVLSKIKYNAKPLKEHFEKMCNELLGQENNLSKNDFNTLYKMQSPEMQKQEFKSMLDARKVTGQKLEELTKHFNRYVEVGGKAKLTTETIKIITNVLVSQVIGCTLLNVIYGKIMKGWTKHKEKQAQIEQQNINNLAIKKEGLVA